MTFLPTTMTPGIDSSPARTALRFYSICLLLVSSTIYLPHKESLNTSGLVVLAFLAGGVMAVLAYFPWDRFEQRSFILFYAIATALLMAMLIYFTGGLESRYNLLFILAIFFSYYQSLMEMYAITTLVALVFLLPYLYDKPSSYQFAESAVMLLVFYFSTYLLYRLTRTSLKKNRTLEELNKTILKLSSLATDLLEKLEEGLPEAFSDSVKEHIPSTYCIVLQIDNEHTMTPLFSCSVRNLEWSPSVGTKYHPEQLIQTRKIFESGKPRLYQLEIDDVDQELKRMIPGNTHSLFAFPIKTGTDDGIVVIFGEERQGKREPFSNEKIRLAGVISNQIATALRLKGCCEKLAAARNDLEHVHDKLIKAERLSMLEKIAKNVEHEINNPLSVIVNWSEIYRENSSVEPEIQKKFQIIYDMALRIAETIQKLAAIRDTKTI